MPYDTLIIGAGLSGLAAGIRLAYFDKSVCILERHTTIGGLNSFYRLRNRNYDVGLHAVTNYAAPGSKSGPLSKLLRQLRLRWEDFALCPQLESAVVFPDHTLRFTNEFAFLQQQVAEEFPAQKDNFRYLLQRIDEFDDRSLTPKKFSARAVVENCITDPVLVDMLFCPLMFYGSASPRDMDFGQFAILFKSIFYEGFGRPYEGVRPILKKLVRQFKSLGGELRLRAGVKEILSDNGRATSVVLDSGEVIEAKNVLSSAGSVETLRLCHDEAVPQQLPPAGDISFVEAIYVLDRPPADLGHTQTIVFFSLTPKFHYERPKQPIDLRSGIVCSPNNYAYDMPLADNKIRMTALANPDYWMNLPEDEYVAEKEAWSEQMLDAARCCLPEVRPHITETDVFTPRTIRKFTGHVNGAVYGSPEKISDGRTHLGNLYLCGTDQGYLGIVGSMLSGISIANAYLLK